MQLNIAVGIEIQFICVQCGKEMLIEGQKSMNPSPTLKCPDCGAKVQVRQGVRVPGPPPSRGRFPPLKPKRF